MCEYNKSVNIIENIYDIYENYFHKKTKRKNFEEIDFNVLLFKKYLKKFYYLLDQKIEFEFY